MPKKSSKCQQIMSKFPKSGRVYARRVNVFSRCVVHCKRYCKSNMVRNVAFRNFVICPKVGVA